ncbi:unnamed protein product [Enterobius vermicularis]|uniref:Innexin n=1 Tax=Enterobius vermicularis TaxID=51028 RepID=A0A0N4VAU6_ENTVE|nr:unnamed protein product [Enterobius vermicularis]
MMIETLIAMMRYLSPRQDDDAVDRLNYLFTPNILLAFAVLISFKQFGGHPIECITASKLPGSWEEYAENYCWAQDTYFVKLNEPVALVQQQDRYTENRRLTYYKWVPFFLLFQAALFRLPSLFWNYLSFSSGIRINEIVTRAVDPANMEEPNQSHCVAVLAKHIQNALRFQRRIHKTLTFLNIRYTAFFISLMYMITKTLYLTNALLQIYILNRFLKIGQNEWYGLKVIQEVLNGTEWSNSGVFPRVSVCDFTIWQVGNILRYSAQCVLVINMFNEKIFIFLWFWYMLLVTCTLLSFAYWLITLTVPCFNRWFISQSLELSDMKFDPETKRKEVERFISKYLRYDGVFVLRMVTIHAGVIFGTDLVLALWNAFYHLEEEVIRRKEFTPPLDLNVRTKLIPVVSDKSESGSNDYN